MSIEARLRAHFDAEPDHPEIEARLSTVITSLAAQDARSSTRRRIRSLVPSLLAAILVAAIAVTAVMVSSHHSTGGQAATPTLPPVTESGAQGLIGSRWLITSVHHEGESVEIPTSLGGYLAFHADGTFGADDSVNGSNGRFARTSDGFQILAAGGSDVGYGAGTSSAQNLLLESLHEMMYGPSKVMYTRNRVVVAIANDTAILQTQHYTITCVRDGPA